MLSSVLALLALTPRPLTGAAEAKFYGDTSRINTLAFDGKGILWVATKGGLVRVRDGSPVTFGWSGLIEGRGPERLWHREGQLCASVGAATCVWDGSKFITTTTELPLDAETPPLPALSRGTHVSASSAAFLAAYGEGVWQDDKLLKPPPEADFRHVIAMAVRDKRLAIGTQEGQVWTRDGEKAWKHLDLTGCPGSTYAIAEYRGRVFTSSFESGIRVFDGRWRIAQPPTTSAPNPRQIVGFQGKLYVRQTTGVVDRFDGTRWAKNVFPWLLRAGAVSLGVGEDKLLVGQYGGWSEFDGKRWSHFLRLPELEGRFVTAVEARGSEVWIGSQDRGVFVYDRTTKLVSNYDQRHGLGDDWVRCIHLDGSSSLVGMFLKGAFIRQGERWDRLTEAITGEVTGFARSPEGTLYIGSREGLWRLVGGRAMRVPVGGIVILEVQATCGTKQGLWLGLPNGVALLPWSTLLKA